MTEKAAGGSVENQLTEPSSLYTNSILSLTANYNKLNLSDQQAREPLLLDSNTTTVEDYNNNNHIVQTSNNHDRRVSCSDTFDHFISTTDNSTNKWNSLRSDSPFLNDMISPPLSTTQVGRTLSTSELNSGSAPMMCNSISSAGGTTVLGGGGGVQHKSVGNSKKGENCMTHAMPNTLWCLKCHTLICRACAGSDEHRNHNVKTQAKEALRTEIATELVSMQRSLIEVQHLVLKQRDFLLKVLEACSNIKTQVENELVNHHPTVEVAELRDSFCRAKLCLSVLDQAAGTAANGTLTANGSVGTNNGTSTANAAALPTPIELYTLYTSLSAEKQRVHHKYQDLYLQCKFDDLLRNGGQLVDFEMVNRAMTTLQLGGGGDITNGTHLNSGPLLLMANYCLTQIYARQSSKSQQSVGINDSAVAANQSALRSHHFGGHHSTVPDTFPFSPNQLSSSALNQSSSSQPQSTAINLPPLSSAFGGAKSQFLDLAVGTPATQSVAPHLCSGSMHHHHQLHFSSVQPSTASSQLINNALGTFGDNLLSSSSTTTFQQSGGGVNSPLSLLRHGGGGSTSSGTGAGGISFEMNGVSVPITMMSSQKLLTGLQQSGTTMAHQHQLHHHHHIGMQHQPHLLHSTNVSSSSSNSSGSNSIICNPTVHIYPIYFFNIEINGQPCGRILIEVRSDVAPRMAKNFGALASGELGFGYKGCQIFQCWENESIITGDFELNNGRGGRSVFEDGFFMPDDTKILAIRGSVGMRRSQKRHDNMGLVGSQFRIILREMRGFTGIFAFVIEGLDLVEKISQTGDSAGKPQSSVLIVSCGKIN